MTVLRSLAKETIIYGLSYSLGRVVNFLLVTFYLTSYLFATKDGSIAIYQDLYFYIALFLGILTLRMETSFFRFVSKDSENNGLYPLLSQLVFISCGIFFIFFTVFQSNILHFLKYPEAFRSCLLPACLILILDVLSSLPFAKLRYQKKSIRYAWIKLLGIILNILLVLYLFEIHFSANEKIAMSSSDKIYYILIANVAASIVSLLFLINEIKDSFKLADWSMFKSLMEYSWPLILVTFVYTIIQNAYTSFLKYLLPGSNTENLSQSDDLVAAVRLAVIMNIFITAFNYAAEPFFFRHAQHKDARQTYAQLNLFFTIACCLIYILTCMNVHLVSLLVGKEYRSAIHLLPILLMANIFSGLFTNMSSWYKLNDKTKEAAWISLIGLILNIVLFIVLVPIYGKNVAAWISLIVYFSMTLISYTQGQKHYPIPYNLTKIGFYLFISIAMVYGFDLLRSIFYLNNLTMMLISIIVSLLMIFFVYIVEWKSLIKVEEVS